MKELTMNGILKKTGLRIAQISWMLLALGTGASVEAGTKVDLVTVKGTITLELFDEDKPRTVQNFIRIVEAGYYRNMFFHRLDPDFVIQGGGYGTNSRTSSNLFQQYTSLSDFGSIENEYSSGRQFSNAYGTVAMARISGQPDSATNEWFINLADNGFLDSVDGGFTVFGRVIRGFEVLNAFQALRLQPSGGILDLRQVYGPSAGLFAELPVNYFGTTLPKFSDLFYVDVEIFKAQIELMANGSRKISWESVANIPNYIEATSSLTNPQWSVIATRQGTGNLISVEDNRFLNGPVYYRIRLDYPL